ncbi:hypothetical protein [Kribbella sp. NPDC000426]|uniref:hypothetical protein n=1 Tax=Kribbella sp. NPDC000426 TaxID=3154255 RepID=UPI00332B0D89
MIFVVVRGFALAALKISPTVGGGLFVSLAIGAAIKAGSVLVNDAVTPASGVTDAPQGAAARPG